MSSKEKAAHQSISKTEEDKTGKYRILSSDMLAVFKKYKKSRVCKNSIEWKSIFAREHNNAESFWTRGDVTSAHSTLFTCLQNLITSPCSPIKKKN